MRNLARPFFDVLLDTFLMPRPDTVTFALRTAPPVVVRTRTPRVPRAPLRRRPVTSICTARGTYAVQSRIGVRGPTSDGSRRPQRHLQREPAVGLLEPGAEKLTQPCDAVAHGLHVHL